MTIEVGQIYIAADGGKYGHIVTDVTTFAYCNDIVTNRFTAEGITLIGDCIDSFKLSKVRYYLVEKPPEWMPIINMD